MIALAIALSVIWVLVACVRTARPGTVEAPAGAAPDDAVVHGGDGVPAHVIARLAAELGRPGVGLAVPSTRARHTDTVLARLQDMEWVGIAELHARRGQALSALAAGVPAVAHRSSITPQAPDVVVAGELAAQGWTTAFAPSAVIPSEPAASMRVLLRSRRAATRGLLRGCRHLPALLRARRWQDAAALLTPFGLLFVGLLLVGCVVAAFVDPAGASRVAVGPGGTHLVAWYALLFAPAWVAGFTYWTRHEQVGLARSIARGHLFVPYSLHWVVAAWLGLLRR